MKIVLLGYVISAFSFIVAIIASWISLKFVIDEKVRCRFEKVVAKSLEDEKGASDDKLKEEKKLLDLPRATSVGKVERLVYAFAVIDAHYYSASAYVLISGWLVLKAFSKWVERPDLATPVIDGSAVDKVPFDKILKRYHVSLLGNGYSVLGGLAAGVAGCAAFGLTRGILESLVK